MALGFMRHGWTSIIILFAVQRRLIKHILAGFRKTSATPLTSRTKIRLFLTSK
jgi:hypothetical protein